MTDGALLGKRGSPAYRLLVPCPWDCRGDLDQGSLVLWPDRFRLFSFLRQSGRPADRIPDASYLLPRLQPWQQHHAQSRRHQENRCGDANAEARVRCFADRFAGVGLIWPPDCRDTWPRIAGANAQRTSRVESSSIQGTRRLCATVAWSATKMAASSSRGKLWRGCSAERGGHVPRATVLTRCAAFLRTIGGASGHVICRRNVVEYPAHAAHALRGDLRCFPFQRTRHPSAQSHLAIENRNLHDLVRQSEFKFQAPSYRSGKVEVADRNDGVCGHGLFSVATARTYDRFALAALMQINWRPARKPSSAAGGNQGAPRRCARRRMLRHSGAGAKRDQFCAIM